jgi:hypothetical protein
MEFKMSKKELRDRNDRSREKQRLTKSKTAEETEQQPTPASTILQQAGIDPRLLAPRDLKQLQRSIGNRAAGQLLEGSPPALQRQELSEEEEELQLKADIPVVGPEGGPIAPEVGAAIQSARGSGQPLEGAVQAQMGETLGHDFSDVRVHTGEQADALNQQLSAKAFTTGQDLFFSEGAYEPGSSRGQELLAHELTHVVQQSSGQVRGSESGMTVRPAGDEFEQEADLLAQSNGRKSDTISNKEQTQKSVQRQSEVSRAIRNPVAVVQRQTYIEAANYMYDHATPGTELGSRAVGVKLPGAVEPAEDEIGPIHVPVDIKDKSEKVINGQMVRIYYITPKDDKPKDLGKVINLAKKAVGRSLDALGEGIPPELIRVLITSAKDVKQQAFVTRTTKDDQDRYIYTIVTSPANLFDTGGGKEFSVPGELAKRGERIDKSKFAEASLIHEMGHLLHAFQNPVLFNAAALGRLKPDQTETNALGTNRDIITTRNDDIMICLRTTFGALPELSTQRAWNYATSTIAEVVAEVYTAIMNRKRVPPQFAYVYLAFSGIRGGEIDRILAQILERVPDDMTPDNLLGRIAEL